MGRSKQKIAIEAKKKLFSGTEEERRAKFKELRETECVTLDGVRYRRRLVYGVSM